jgi:hypothetical protein
LHETSSAAADEYPSLPQTKPCRPGKVPETVTGGARDPPKLEARPASRVRTFLKSHIPMRSAAQ